MRRALVVLAAFTAWAADTGYRDSLAKWRSERESALKADGGWLTVTGLIWLKEGANRVSTAPGVFELRNGKTMYRPDSGAPATEMGPAVAVDAGDLTLTVIERGGRYAVRV